MNTQLYRFSLNNDTYGAQIVREPLEWQTSPIKLERDKNYHAIFEFYDTQMTFTEIGLSYIRRVKALGPDAELSFLIEISEDAGVTWETFFDGLLDIATADELEWPKEYQLQISAKRNALWSKFLNRIDKSIDLQSPVDLDGNQRVVMPPIDQNLTGQIIRENYSGFNDDCVPFFDDNFAGGNKYVTVDFDNTVLDEVQTRNIIGSGVWDTLKDVPVCFAVKDGGNYTFDIRLEASIKHNNVSGFGGSPTQVVTYNDPVTYTAGGPTAANLQFYFQKNKELPVQFVANHYGSGVLNSEVYSLSAYNITLAPSDQIKIYGIIALDLNALEDSQNYVNLIFWGKNVVVTTFNNVVVDPPDMIVPQWHYFYQYRIDGSKMTVGIITPPSGSVNPGTFTVLAKTTFGDSTVKAFMVHEAGQTILDRIIGDDDTLYSPYYGNPFTQRATYGDTGCGSNRCLAQGTQIRTFTLAEKPAAMSFTDWFGGLNPIDNIGIGTKVVGGKEKIYIDSKRAFYDASSNSVNLFLVNKVHRKTALDLVYNGATIGYSTWKSTTLAAIDDPQTSHEYATPIKFIGNPISLMSGLIAASLTWEFTRRQAVDKSSSWTLDGNIFILENVITLVDGVPVYTPELQVNGTDPVVTNLNDPTTRYNKTITPARNFYRNLSLLNIGVQQYAQKPTYPAWVYGTNYSKGDIVQAAGSFYIATANSLNLPPNIYPSKWAPFGYYIFLTGEGNVAMSCNITTDSCDGTDVALVVENANIPITTDALKGIDVITFEHPLSWSQYKTIRDNREKSIGVSLNGEDPVPYFIEVIEYRVFSRKATFTLTQTT